MSISSIQVRTVIAIALAISLQVLVTFNFFGTDIRVGSSDFLLPLILGWMFWEWRQGTLLNIKWKVPHLWVWLGVLTAWMVFSVFIGRFYTGEWVTWGIINKGAGWLVLASYFVIGGWLGNSLEEDDKELFLKVLFCFGWAVSAVALVLYFLLIHWAIGPELFRALGLFENPNAYGIFLACLLCLQLPYMKSKALFSSKVHIFAFALIFTTMLFSGSRSAWLGLGFALWAMLSLRMISWRNLVQGGIAAFMMIMVFLFAPQTVREATQTTEGFLNEYFGMEYSENLRESDKWRSYNLYIFRQNTTREAGVSYRWLSTRKGINLWLSAPFVGGGLGSFVWLMEQTENLEELGGMVAIHNTTLWLLAETGVIGFSLFLVFFIICIRALGATRTLDSPDLFSLGVFGALLVLATASLGTEILYQRYIWFFMGMGLAMNAVYEKKKSEFS